MIFFKIFLAKINIKQQFLMILRNHVLKIEITKLQPRPDDAQFTYLI